MHPLTLLLGGLAFVIVGNLFIHLWMGRMHQRVRESLRPAEVLFRAPDVRGSLSARGLLSAAVSVASGELLVTDRAVVFFQRVRGPIPMKQPPVVVVRDEASDLELPWGTPRLQVDGAPERGRTLLKGRPCAVLKARNGRWVRFALKIQVDESGEVLAALQRFVDGPAPR